MKILMLGWEFPPHISGGLGTACQGIVNGLGRIPDTNVIFVVPKVFGGEKARNTVFAGADRFLEHHSTILDRQVRIVEQDGDAPEETRLKDAHGRLIYIETASMLHPYMQAEQIERILEHKGIDPTSVWFDKTGRMMATKDGKDTEITLTYSDTQYANDDGGDGGQQQKKFEFTGRYTPNLYNETGMYARVVGQMAQDHDFDIIHAHDWLTYEAGVAIKETTGKPLVVHVHATEYDRSGGSVNQRVFNIEKHGMQQADAIVSVSNLTRQTIIDKYGIEPDKVQTVYNAVDFKPIRRQPKKKGEPRLVTFLGRITHQKGPVFFLRAAYKVLEKIQDARFVMAGNGDMYHKLITEAARLGIADKFHFTDFLDRSQVRKLLSITDVFVMPSVSEPFGIVPLEAAKAGVPVIISKQSGVAEVLDSAVKVDYWDDNALANAIYSLLKYPALARHLSQHGQKEADSMNWDFSAADIRNIYEKLLDDDKNPATDGDTPENQDRQTQKNILIKH